MSTILLFGGGGQTGVELRALLPCLGATHAPSRGEVALERPESIREVVRAVSPAIIVNAAAYNAVDNAETDGEAAMRVNAAAPGVLAEEAKRAGALLIHYSTDYVFDGKKDAPYDEDDAPAPVNAYGASKLAGERAVQGAGCRYLILRTSWVYSAGRSNFVLNILKLAREKSELRVVDDQTGSPTWARALAEATVALIGSAGSHGETALLHAAAAGGVSRWQLACRAIERARELSGIRTGWARVERTTSADYRLPARRPVDTTLSSERMAATRGVRMESWDAQLERFLTTTDVLARVLPGPR